MYPHLILGPMREGAALLSSSSLVRVRQATFGVPDHCERWVSYLFRDHFLIQGPPPYTGTTIIPYTGTTTLIQTTTLRGFFGELAGMRSLGILIDAHGKWTHCLDGLRGACRVVAVLGFFVPAYTRRLVLSSSC